MTKARKRYPPIVEMVLGLIMILAIAIGAVYPVDEWSSYGTDMYPVEGDCIFQVDDDEPMVVDLVEGISVLKPVSRTSVKFMLPEEAAESGTLAFRTTQSSVEVLIDGKLAYSYLMDNVAPNKVVAAIPFVHMIDLDRDMAGKTFEIIEHFPQSRYFGNWGVIHYGRGAEIECHYYTSQFEGLLFSLLLLTIAIFSLVMTIFSKEKDKRQAHFATCIVNVVFMLWLISQTHSKQIILVNPLLSGYLMFIAIFLLPSSLVGFLYTHYDINQENRGVLKLFLVTSTFLLGLPIVVVLDWLGVVSMMSLLVPISALCMLITINILISAIIMNRKGIRMVSFIIAMILILLSFLLEEILLLLKIPLKSPLILHVLMFAGALILFLKSVSLLFADNDKQGIKTDLSHEMMLDPLTGLLSRMAYEDFLDNFHRLQSKTPAYIFVVDANGLKIINDEQGHTMGDTLLKSIAGSLSRVFEGGKVFRIGGDEFLVYIEDDGETGISDYCRHFREDLDESFTNAASIGGAYYDPTFRNDIHDVIHNADLRMYHEKPTYQI